jgi:hypothetical protein
VVDSELEAMGLIANALRGLDGEQVRRVLLWASDKFGVQLRPSEAAGQRTSAFGSLADLYDAANPSSEAQKLLVVAYWFQVVQGNVELESQVLNKALKNLGHAVGNITRAFGSLAETSPRLVIQTRKTGSSKQARKRFKLTVEGIRWVGQMLGDVPAGTSGRSGGGVLA